MRTTVWPLVFILCSSCSIFDGNSSSPIKLDRSWELVSFVDNEGEELSMYDYEVHTLRFEENEPELGGEAACNNYGDNYLALENGKMTIKELAVTEALCRQPSLGEEFVDAIVKVHGFNKKGGELTLFYGTEGRLIFSERLEE